MPPFDRLGRQIDRLIRTLAATKFFGQKKAIGETVMYVADKTGYSDSTVRRWRQGRLRPPDDTLERLARIGREEADLDRAWGRDLLRAAGHPDADGLVNQIWGPQQPRSIPHNLPPQEHTRFIGRQEEMAKLLRYLSPHHAAHLISVDGIGGVGKTALVLEAAYRCLRASTGEAPDPMVPTFDAIIFTSAKQHHLTPHGILRRSQAQRTLRDIFREVAHTLNRLDITNAAPEEQPERVREALARQRTLLIVDNLETMQDAKEEIFEFLFNLPPTVKVIITTREQALFSPIRLDQLTEEESDVVLQRVIQASGDVARFCFEGSVAPLRGEPAHRLLMSIAMFPKRPLREAVVAVAGLGHDPIAADEGLARLQQLRLIDHRDGRYSMLPLTREYALAELAAHPDFEQEAQEQWVRWYKDFVHKHGGDEWAEWHREYDLLEEEWENILAVLHWCAGANRYEDVREIWEKVEPFAFIYGHWDDEMDWLRWITEQAERRGDWHAAMECKIDYGWLCTMKGDVDGAAKVLEEPWKLSANLRPETRYDLFLGLARLSIRRQEPDQALAYLRQAEDALQQAEMTDQMRRREQITLTYWRAVAFYEKGDHAAAKPLFEHVVADGSAIQWQRVVYFAQNYLADMAVERGRLDEAEQLLLTGLPVTERNKDRRRAAFYKRSFAHLERRRGNVAEARRWATEALDDFDRLGMKPEAEEMRRFLEALEGAGPGET